MTTKKEKREATLAKREKFMAQNKQDGLASIRRARVRREQKNYRDWEDTHTKKHNSKKWGADCPWCKDDQKAAIKEAKEN